MRALRTSSLFIQENRREIDPKSKLQPILQGWARQLRQTQIDFFYEAIAGFADPSP